jgi:hypothetical protein
MRTPTSPPHTRQRLLGLAATVAVHIALVAGWIAAREKAPDPDGAPAAAIQWLTIRPRPPATVTPAPVRRTQALARRTRVAGAASRTAPAARLVVPAAVAEPAAAPAAAPATPAAAPAAPAKTAYDILQQARRDLGGIDAELSKQYPGRTIRAPIDTPQKRLEKGIELANELAPPKWYQPAKIKEVTDPGGYGRKRYRVITAHGTYCMTYESAHSPDGRDPMTRNTAPKMTNCDSDLPSTAQKWSTQ